MKSTYIFLAAALFGITAVLPADAAADRSAPIYDASADGAKQIFDALAVAKTENKRVLLQFGANWCIWCHRLYDLLQTDKQVNDALKAGYVLVLVDVNKGHNRETDLKYGNPTKSGIPMLVVLDADGKQLTTKDTSDLEEGDHHSPQKTLAFLKDWAPKP